MYIETRKTPQTTLWTKLVMIRCEIMRKQPNYHPPIRRSGPIKSEQWKFLFLDRKLNAELVSTQHSVHTVSIWLLLPMCKSGATIMKLRTINLTGTGVLSAMATVRIGITTQTTYKHIALSLPLGIVSSMDAIAPLPISTRCSLIGRGITSNMSFEKLSVALCFTLSHCI